MSLNFLVLTHNIVQVAGVGGKQTIVINKPAGGQVTAGGQQVNNQKLTFEAQSLSQG